MSFGRRCWKRLTSSKTLELTHCSWFTVGWVLVTLVLVRRLMGSYAAIIGGTSGEALEDFMGGVLEAIDLKNAKYA